MIVQREPNIENRVILEYGSDGYEGLVSNLGQILDFRRTIINARTEGN